MQVKKERLSEERKKTVSVGFLKKGAESKVPHPSPSVATGSSREKKQFSWHYHIPFWWLFPRLHLKRLLRNLSFFLLSFLMRNKCGGSGDALNGIRIL